MSLSAKESTKRKFVKLHDDWKNCKRCKLCKVRNKVVVGYGNMQSKFLIIGQNPGAEEDKIGIPFIGNSGKELDRVIGLLGLNRDMFYITNVAACLTPGNRKPKDSEVKACSKRLDRIIKILDPKLIICLGDTAIRRMFPDYRKSMTLESARGLYKVERPPRADKRRYIYCTYHPSAILRNSNLKKNWKKDWRKIVELILTIEEGE